MVGHTLVIWHQTILCHVVRSEILVQMLVSNLRVHKLLLLLLIIDVVVLHVLLGVPALTDRRDGPGRLIDVI